MVHSLKALFVFAIAAMLVGGCNTAPKSEEGRENLVSEADASLNRFKQADPGLNDFMQRGYGYAIFPSVGKGGLIAGGAYGKGVVYEQRQQVGYSDLTQASIGAQIGGQTYAELVVFENKPAMDRFKSGKFSLAANASAVAIKSGAAAGTTFRDGVAIFTMPLGGLMAEASIGGQEFSYVPNSRVESTSRE
jgi:lipid-binding SYLF domain-containing protein